MRQFINPVAFATTPLALAIGLVCGAAPVHSQEQLSKGDASKDQPAKEDVRPASTSSDVPALPEVRVISTQELPAYQADEATGATRIAAPLRDIPQTVNVVTETLVEDQAARSLQDTLQNVPGVSFNIGDGQRDQVVIRGFDAIGDQYVDGLRDDALYYRDLSNLEAVEVVKGPAAVLYGRGSSGGIVNRITKKPGPSIREAELVTGSFSRARAAFDVGNSLGTSADFRITGALEDSGSFREEGFIEREAIAPSISLDISPNSSVLVQAERLHDRRITDMGIPAFRGSPVDVPIETYYGTADAERDDYTDADMTSGRVAFEHRIGTGLTLRADSRAYSYTLDRQNTFAATVDDATGTASLFHGASDRKDDGWVGRLELAQEVSVAGMKHQPLYGVEVSRQTKDLRSWNWSVRPTVDVFDPARPPLAAFGVPVLGNDNETKMDVSSVYVQDLVTLSPQWKALLGVRYDVFEQAVDDRLTGQSDRQRTDREWSPRAGLVFQPSAWQSWYLSYSQSFQPSGETLAFSTAQADMAPEQTSNVEVGAKLDLFDGKLSTTASVFRLERTEIKNTDPTTQAIVPVGTQRTDGIELTAAGDVAPGWQLSAGYAYLDAEITESIAIQNGVSLEGNTAALTPRHSANAWLMRNLGHGWRLGGGLNYVGARFTSQDNLVTLDSYVTADAALVYESKTYDVALNAKNITDNEYFVSGHGSSNNLNAPGAPRSIELTARLRF